MLEPKAVIRFALIATAAYIVLTGLWMIPPFERGYALFFRTVGDTFFSRFWFWPEARVRFLNAGSHNLRDDIEGVLPGELPENFTPPGERGDRDTMLVLMNKRVPQVPGFLRTSSRFLGFAPTALLIALCVATPIVWRRRIWLLLWSLMFLHVFILIRLTVLILKGGFADPAKKYALFRPSEFWWEALRRLDLVLCDNPTFAYLCGLPFWLLALFLFEVWASVRRKPGLLEAGETICFGESATLFTR